VDVERFAEELHRNRGALEVHRAPFADRRLPRGLFSFFAFQRTKSSADSFSYSSGFGMRLYSVVVSISTFDSFP